MNKPRRFRKIIRWLLIGLLGLVVLLGAFFALLQTPWAKQRLGDFIAAKLSDQITFSCSHLTGLVPFDIQVGEVTASDEDGRFLEINNARVAWAPLSLFGGSVTFQHLGADRVVLERMPSVAKASPAPGPSTPRVPELPSVRILEIRFPHIEFGEEIAGERMIFSAGGDLKRPAPEHFSLRAHIERTDRRGLRGTFSVDRREQRLRAEGEFYAPPDGILTLVPALRTDKELSLHLSGDGPLDNWQGDLEALAGSAPVATATFRVALDQRALACRFDGRVVPQEVLAQLDHEFISEQGSMMVTADGRYGFDSRVLSFESLEIRVPAGGMKGSGSVDFAKRVADVTLTADIDDLRELQPLFDVGLRGSVQATLSAVGPWSAPRGQLEVAAQEFHIGDIRLGSVRANLSSAQAESERQDITQVSLTGQASLSTVELDGKNLAPGGPLQIDVDAGLETAHGGVLTLREMTVTSGGKKLSASGRVSATGEFDVDVTAEIDQIGELPYVKLGEISTGVDAQARVKGNWRKRSVDTRLVLTARDIEDIPAAALDVLGSHPRFEAELAYRLGQPLDIISARLDAEHARVTANGEVALSPALNLQLMLEAPELAAVEPLQAAGIQGRLEVSAQLEGPRTRLTLDAQGTLGELRYRDIPVGDVVFSVTAGDIAETPSGRLAFALEYANTPFALETDYVLDNDVLTLPSVTVTAPETQASGRVELNLERRRIDGKIDVSARSLAWLDAFLPVAPDGTLQLGITAGGPWSEPAVSAEYVLRDLEIERLRIGQVQGTVSHRPSESVSLEADLSAEDVTFGMVHVAAFDFHAAGASTSASIQVTTLGTARAPFRLETQGLFAVTGSDWTLSLESGSATYASLPLEWSRPLELRHTADTVTLRLPQATVGDGSLRIEFEKTAEALEGKASLSNLPLQHVSAAALPLQGSADFDVELSGSLQQPVASLTVKFRDIGIKGYQPGTGLELAGSMSARYDEGELKGNADISSQSEDRMDARFSLPFALQFSPFVAEPRGPLAAEAELRAALAPFSPLFLPGSQRLTGQVEGSLLASGSVDAPELDGQLTLQGGTYDNAVSGTTLRNLTCDAQIDKHSLVIRTVDASDGTKGTLSGSGRIQWNEALRGQLELTFSSMQLIRLDTATGSVDGNLVLNLDPDSPELNGELTLAPLHLFIPKPPPKGMTGITVVQSDGPPGETGGEQGEQNALPAFLNHTVLGVSVSLPDRCFVRGRGVDSEWQGLLNIGGTLGQPAVGGKVSVVRGHVNFLGRRFVLREGHVQFVKETPPDPVCDILATSETGDLTVRLRVSGPVTNPTMALSSDPAYPRDEILARLLFGTSLSQITPLQAVKIALAVRTLTGGGVGITERLRRGFGIDNLELRTTEEGQAVVGVGKYLAEDVYFRVEQGARADLTQVVVEIELTPHISLESTTGTMTQGVDLRWRYRY